MIASLAISAMPSPRDFYRASFSPKRLLSLARNNGALVVRR